MEHLVAHVHPSAPYLNLDVVVPLLLLVAASRTRRSRDLLVMITAAVALLATAVPPLHTAALSSVTGHMVQHLVIILVAAPLLGLVAAGAPTRLRSLGPVPAVTRSGILPTWAPLVAGTIHAAVFAAWHVPVPYDAAVASVWIHSLEHLTLLSTGVWWWAAITHHVARRHALPSLVSLFVGATAGAALGVFMMFAPSALYTQGGVSDQQTAGALMAGGMGLVLGGTALWLGTRALQDLATPRPRRIGVAAGVGERGNASVGVVLACVAGAIVGMVLLGPSTSGADAQDTPPEDPPPAERDQATIERDQATLGRDLYGRDCASCHGADGSGSFRGTSLREVGAASVTYVLETGRMPIAHPDAPIRRSDPAYDQESIDAIVAHVDQFIDGPAAVDPDIEAASVARGGEHYRLHCAACHGAEGIGGALAFDDITPSVLHSSPRDVANAVTVGPGAMPSFTATFDDADLADIAAYVGHLQDPPTRGIPLPGGRVTEGLVAWLAGMGALVLMARWLGARA
ncbi:MAG: cytochrome c oxidase assembly protein [Acidimicrobiales bacterium]